MESARVMF